MLKAKLIMVSVPCIFTILFLVSMAYADWPPNDTEIVAGYAQLSDSSSYKFRSDGGGYYTDVHLKGEPGEKVELALDDGVLEGVLLYLGKPDQKSYPNPSTLGEPPYYCSTRQSNFWFDVIKDGKTTSQYKKYAAAIDILAYTDASKKVRRGNLGTRGKYYLNNDIIRLAIRRWHDDNGNGTLVHDLIFTVEPSETPCGGCGEGAVTQTAIDNFYTNDVNVDYRDYLDIETSPCDLAIYRIAFDNDFSITKVNNNTWLISGSGSAHLGPILHSNGSMVRLVDYNNLSFSVTVSTTYPFSAPRRWDTAATLWGDIKSHK